MTSASFAFVPSFEDNGRKLTRLFTAGDHLTTCITTPHGSEVVLSDDQDDSSVMPTVGGIKSLSEKRAKINHQNDRRAFVVTSMMSSLPLFTTIKSANAITPEQASKSYDTYAATYDNLDGGSIASSLGIDEARKNLLRTAKGDVLEIGVGTGLNLDSYQFEAIRSLTLVDISEGMLSQARLRIDQLLKLNNNTPIIKFVQADATSELSSLFGENTFDTVVDTFSLCVMGNEGANRCLDEMARVVKKSEDGGQIILIENTRASNPVLGYYQDITASTAADIGGKGCIYNQNVGEMIRQTKGLQITKEEAFAAGLFRSFTCQKI